ncbi:MAG: hypothetical protein ACAH59_08950 [Pseudobdellovibrionaceae bacterium]
MLFSCKISSAVLSYFEKQGEDSNLLLESTSLPEEFLCDPSYWMKAGEMENFLLAAQRIAKEEGPLLQKIGHAGPELRSWGVLDSVLRMMPRPQEIFSQPQRFLSYFISPEPPVDHVIKTEFSIELDLPVSSEIYPLVTTYLKSAFESLPVYVGKPLATGSWNDIHLKINWASEQESIFEQDPGHQISPELLRSVVSSLELHQRELEEKNRELQVRNEQLSKAQREMEAQIAEKVDVQGVLSADVHQLDFIDENSIQILTHHISRLTDYMVRAQQLVTMLVGQERTKPAVKEAMRRIDWDRIKTQFPLTVQETRHILEKTQKKYQEQNHV